jgi:hypothetical protein
MTFRRITDPSFSMPNIPEDSNATVTTANVCTTNVLYVFLYRTGNIDTTKASIVDWIRLNDLWLEMAMDEEETQKNGMVLIIDLGGLPLRLFKFLCPKATIISALKEEVILDCKLPNCDWVSHSLSD